jgi:ornithine cyclodeaminase/alanine dehydrogenase-like protein (mu-crystallin family)
VLVLDSAQVGALLDLGALIDALGPAMAELSAGRAQAPERVAATVAGHGVLLAMPGYVPSARDALVCVESRSAALAPFPAGTNDLLEPIRDGLITAAHVHAELGDLVSGARSGCKTP